MSELGGARMFDDPIQAQYERWVYPGRFHDVTALQLNLPQLSFQDLRNLFWLFWPGGSIREDVDILAAGCGSLEAAVLAYVYPKARVVGIDISRASLEHTASLQRKHNLTNLTLQELRVEDAGSLGSSFDFIICHYVLHHLADPAAGLRALGQALRRDGVIDIIINGKYGRLGVTALQELFRVMGVEQDAAGLLTVRNVLASLPPTHPVQNYRRLAAQDLS